MNYSQSANPNATNGEQDAKKIITNRQLNSFQHDELVEQYVEIVVDRMNYDDKYNDDFGSDVFTQLWDKVTNL